MDASEQSRTVAELLTRVPETGAWAQLAGAVEAFLTRPDGRRGGREVLEQLERCGWPASSHPAGRRSTGIAGWTAFAQPSQIDCPARSTGCPPTHCCRLVCRALASRPAILSELHQALLSFGDDTPAAVKAQAACAASLLGMCALSYSGGEREEGEAERELSSQDVQLASQLAPLVLQSVPQAFVAALADAAQLAAEPTEGCAPLRGLTAALRGTAALLNMVGRSPALRQLCPPEDQHRCLELLLQAEARAAGVPGAAGARCYGQAARPETPRSEDHACALLSNAGPAPHCLQGTCNLCGAGSLSWRQPQPAPACQQCRQPCSSACRQLCWRRCSPSHPSHLTLPCIPAFFAPHHHQPQSSPALRPCIPKDIWNPK